MSLIVVRLIDHGAATGQLEISLGALKRLNRRLLIDGKDDRVLRWRHVQTDDLCRLGHKLRVVALAPRLASRQIDLLSPQKAPDVLLMHITQRARQQRCRPVRIAFRGWLIEQRKVALLIRGTVFGRSAAVPGLVQPSQTRTRITNPPLRRRSGGAAHDPADLSRCYPRRRQTRLGQLSVKTTL